MKKLSAFCFFLFCFSILNVAAYAQIGILNTNPVTQNFNSIATTTLPANWKMSSEGAGGTSGWATATNVTAATAISSSGAPTAGGRYVWATTGGTEKSIGFMTSGGYASPNSIMAYYQNQTGSTIADLTINFQFERYRVNMAAASVTFFTSTDGTTWTAQTTGDIPASSFPTGASAYTFGAPATVTRSVTLTGVNIPNNGDYYVRWIVNTAGSNSQGLGLDDVSVIATLAPPPTLSVNDVTLAEGNSGTTNFQFTVALSSPAQAGGVVFDIATADGTATTGNSDYAANSMTNVVIPAGQQNATFTVEVTGDAANESDETFFVNVTNVTGATPLDAQGLGTILNDDSTIDLEFANYGEDEAQPMIVVVTRSGNTSAPATVDYETVFSATRLRGAVDATPGPSCTGSTDYVPISGTLTFAAGETSQQISITICGDQATETIEGFPIVLFNPVNASLGPNTPVLATINDAASQYVNISLIGVPSSGDSSAAEINVASSATTISGLRVTLYDAQHLFSADLDVLLVGPGGQKMLLMADAGGPSGLSDPATITFSDSAGQVVPQNAVIESGVYEPTTWEPNQTSFTSPAPAGPYAEPGSAIGGPVTLASVFGGTNPNGTWTLYVRDDGGAFQRFGINGELAGWGLQFAIPTASEVFVEGRVRSGKNGIANATVVISGGDLAESRTVRTNQLGLYRFDGLTAGQTYVVTVDSRRFTFTQPSVVVSVGDSVVDLDFVAVEP